MQLQADVRGRNTVSGIEVDVMLKAQELRLHEAIDPVDKNNELRVKFKTSSFSSELKELRIVAKERHVLFVKVVKTVR